METENKTADRVSAGRGRKKHHGTNVMVVCVMLVVAFAAGSICTLLINSNYAFASKSEKQLFERLTEVYDILMNNYYKEVDSETLEQGAIDGMMASLGDRYTFYYTPEEMEDELESMSGEYVGIGMVLGLTQEGQLVVMQVYQDSPAEKAGLKAGDRLMAVEGTDVSEGTQETLNQAASMIRGTEGTDVTMTYERDGETIVLTATRGVVAIQYASYAIREDGLMVLTLSGFNGNMATVMEKAIQEANEKGCPGMIIDLRSNPGGQLSVVLDAMDLVIPKNLLVYMEDRNGARESFYSDDEYDPIPIAVLIDENSASASELFSGAVKDTGRGKIYGTTSFGKGIVQTVHVFDSDGAGLQYTSEVYYTPSGTCVHGVGITPDVEITDDPETEIDEVMEKAAADLLGETVTEENNTEENNTEENNSEGK